MLKMADRVTKSMATGAGVIGFILLASGLGCSVAGFIFSAYADGALGIWGGIFVSIFIFDFFHPYFNCREFLVKNLWMQALSVKIDRYWASEISFFLIVSCGRFACLNHCSRR